MLRSPAAAPTVIQTGAGNDAVNVITGGNSLGGPLEVDAGAGANQIVVNDSARTSGRDPN